jgi:DNA repair protein RadC
MSQSNILELVGCGSVAEDEVLYAAQEIMRRKRNQHPIISHGGIVASHLRAAGAIGNQEKFFVLTLNTKNRLIKMHTVFLGSISECLIHPREVFRKAIEDNAFSIIIAHNHPSGDSNPSAEDKIMTQRLVDCSGILGIPILDHVIMSECDYFSFADECIMPKPQEGGAQ